MIPERYGGSKSDVVTYGIICEELARADWVVASVVSVSNSLVAGSILRWGSEAQKEKWLPAIAAGDCITSACLTEPGGGTDLGNMKTTATRVPGGWRAQRHQGVHLARRARGPVLRGGVDRSREEAQGRDGVAGRSARERGDHDRRVPDAHAQARQRGRGALQGRFVPDENLLGEPGGGFPVLGSALDMGRYSVAARCVGQAQRCIDLAVAYAREREAFGQKIGEFQMIQQKIADMICRTEGARGVVYRLGRMKDAGVERASMEASLAKLMASEAATQNALDAIQIHGGYGVTAEYEVGRLLLEAKVLEIGEGTSELHRKLIAEHALGLRTQ